MRFCRACPASCAAGWVQRPGRWWRATTSPRGPGPSSRTRTGARSSWPPGPRAAPSCRWTSCSWRGRRLQRHEHALFAIQNHGLLTEFSIQSLFRARRTITHEPLVAAIRFDRAGNELSKIAILAFQLILIVFAGDASNVFWTALADDLKFWHEIEYGNRYESWKQLWL